MRLNLISSSIILLSETLLQTLDFAPNIRLCDLFYHVFHSEPHFFSTVTDLQILVRFLMPVQKHTELYSSSGVRGGGALMDHSGLWWSTVTHPVIYFKQNGLMWRGPGKKLAYKSGHTNGPFFFPVVLKCQQFLWVARRRPVPLRPLSSLSFVICRVPPSERMRKVAVAGMYY